MSSTLKVWISAFRLRTLPLALSAILMGTLLADLYSFADPSIFLMASLTAILLQILSNLANDYGDFEKGTDNENRVGNTRAMQSGNITKPAMISMIVVFTCLSFTCGISLLYIAFKGNISLPFLAFLVTGIAAIVSSITYTMGKRAYGYRGWGDFFVFIFFGPVAVLGTFLLHHGPSWNFISEWQVILPAYTIGALCTAVLNTNNIRDIENDAASGKRTIPVRLGLKNARIYHLFLVASAFISFLLFLYLRTLPYADWISILVFIPIFRQAWMVLRTAPSPAFNALLKRLSISTLLLVLVLILMEIIMNGVSLFSLIQLFKHSS